MMGRERRIGEDRGRLFLFVRLERRRMVDWWRGGCLVKEEEGV
uniref:Uncharacterized protein n=1 Tax=Arundo donax TaxID=35708 RepID=A0A0A9HMU2_ARUDO